VIVMKWPVVTAVD